VARRADPVTAYARSVIKGKTPAGELARLACERHLREIGPAWQKAHSLKWDGALAVKEIEFYLNLCHYKGEWAGKPLVLAPWQEFIVGSLFAWKRLDGMRRFREAYEEVPRKNGKSTKDAGVGIRLAFFDGEQGAEVYCVATKKDQARIIFGDAKQMVLRTPALRKRLKVFVNNVSSEPLASKLEPLGADEDTMDGLNVHAALVDEVHAHKTSGVVDAMRTATGARRQPLIKYVTTAGHDRTSVCWGLHEYATKVLKGTVEDDTFFAYIASADPGDDYRDPRTWAKANPNLGVSVSEQDLARKVKQAEHLPSALNAFLRLHLNVWTEQQDRWLDMQAWDGCPSEPIDVVALRGAACMAGLDGASTRDLFAFVLLFGPDEQGFYDVLCRFWIPARTLEAKDTTRSEADRDRLRQWASAGLITVTSGDTTDYDQVEADILEELAKYDLQRLSFDRFGVTQLITHLKNALGEERVVDFPQTIAAMSAPSKELEKVIRDEKLRHGRNPVLRWMASNVAAMQSRDGQQIKPDRQRSGDKIDGVVALIMALDGAMRTQPRTNDDMTVIACG
jgi:phage terminase large subunit-like protein